LIEGQSARFGSIYATRPAATVRKTSSSGARPITRPNGRLTAIRDLLERDQVSFEIVRYLVERNEAADTVRGIAEWWIHRDLPSTAEALARLEKHGVVRSRVVQDATAVYSFTRDAGLREGLRQYVEGAVRAAPGRA
jgi:hypothetical protein